MMDSAADVLPSSTLSKVDEFVASQMRAIPLQEMKPRTPQEGFEKPKYVPRFTVDGYGRWREVNGYERAPCQGLLRDNSMLEVYKSLLKTDAGSPSRSSRSGTTYSGEGRDTVRTGTASSARPASKSSVQSYKHLSTSLRCNVFPGMGKNKWESSTKVAFQMQSIPSSWIESSENYRVTKDDYMKWAEHDVYRQRLMKAWEKYVTETPKVERPVQVKTERVEKSPRKQNDKGEKKKAKQKKMKPDVQRNAVRENEPQKEEPQTRIIEVKPVNSDEDFWDFYEKPFAQS